MNDGRKAGKAETGIVSYHDKRLLRGTIVGLIDCSRHKGKDSGELEIDRMPRWHYYNRQGGDFNGGSHGSDQCGP